MRKAVLAIMATGSVFAMTAAGASGLGTMTGGATVDVSTSATISVTTSACTDPFTVAYVSSDGYQTITGVTVQDTAGTPSASCIGTHTVNAVLSDGAGYTRSKVSGVTLASTGPFTTTITLASAYNVITNPLTSTTITVTP